MQSRSISRTPWPAASAARACAALAYVARLHVQFITGRARGYGCRSTRNQFAPRPAVDLRRYVLSALVLLDLHIAGSSSYALSTSAAHDHDLSNTVENADLDFSEGIYPDPELFSVLSSEEVAYLDALGDEGIARGYHGVLFNPHQPGVDPGVKGILEKIVKRLGRDYSYGDIRNYAAIYTITAENTTHVTSKYHNDACCDEDCSDWYTRFGNGRQWRTGVLVWIAPSYEYEGGHTEFVNSGLSVKGPPGWALKFDLLAKDTLRCHDLAIHRGNPVTSGAKRIFTFTFLAPLEWMETRVGPPGYNATFARAQLEERKSVDYWTDVTKHPRPAHTMQ